MEKLPPTQDALLQHMKRAIYQAGVWATSTQIQQVIPSPQDYGWTKESGSWMPVWLTIPEVSRACRELIKCSWGRTPPLSGGGGECERDDELEGDLSACLCTLVRPLPLRAAPEHYSTVGQTSGQQPACEASSEENLQDRAGMEEVPGSLMAEERVTENEWES
ncbi:hypothetical protein SKAU_G00155950 [Synaphobranchus kaupii]|uniref:Uncharacterized protein n=1 Tax=Synaphobranchus kaupii TaxID=118154 RepID=A0A9Q1IZ99_SYNKA|nr:hypothetical protein SKAU_G00155950 [Synaphobranchus kaupii]